FINQCNHTQVVDLHGFGNFINNLQQRMLSENVGALLTDLVTSIGYEEYLYEHETVKSAEKKWGNVLNLVNWLNKKAEEENKKLPELVQTITLITMLEGREDQEVAAIKLSTLHAAKGLEYPYVFLISCEEGIIPHQESINADLIEEERRLIYVGITRAQKELTISYCEQRRQGGETRIVERSRFLNEIGAEN
ncbi:MAG: 3'-5' exonuclease, partial [Burkholderiales bacterium]